VVLKIQVFLDVTPCIILNTCQCFESS